MAIGKVSIKNFTVFEDIAIDLCPGVNVFIGENGTGKTHLLKVLYAFCGYVIENVDGQYSARESFYAYLCKPFRSIGYDKLARRSPGAVITDTVVPESIIPMVLEFCARDKSYSFESRHIELRLLFVGEDGTKVYNIIDSYYTQSKAEITAAFIPAKDMLTHGELTRPEYESLGALPFDTTLGDTLRKAGASNDSSVSDNMRAVQSKIREAIDGDLVYSEPRYYMDRGGIGQIDFSVESEGHKRLGLIHRLIETGYIKKGSVLLWDEPEANINPKLIPDLVEVILKLSRCGVQVFVATHDYMFAKYFEVRRKDGDEVRFHSLRRTDEGVKSEYNENFRDLKENPIIEAFDELMDEVLGRNLGD